MTAPPHSPHLEELLPAFALGALDGEELRELLEHLDPQRAAAAAADPAVRPGEIAPSGLAEVACPICAAELRRLADDLEAMAMAEEPPSADLRRRALAQVAAEPRRLASEPPAPAPATPVALGAPPAPLTSPVADIAARRRRPTVVWWPRLAAAALLLAAVWGVTRQAGLASEIRRLRGERDRLEARAGDLERQVQAAQAQSERLARTLSILAAPSVESVRLAAMGSSHAAGRTYVDATDRQAVFYASGLPALTPDKTYQLWYIDDEDRKTSAGVFLPNAQGKAALMVEQRLPVERIQSWVVTVEPRGGRPQPTGPIALAG